MKIVIVGAGAGGASAAARIRRLDEHAEIVLIDKHADISQATCGLPYSLGNIIRDRSKLIIVDSEDFSRLVNVDVRTQSQVVSIARDKKTLTIRNLADGDEYEEHYDKLVLSPGGNARLPAIPGIENENVFTLQSLSDLDAIKAYLKAHRCKNAVVVGAGFIGLEVADNLHELGISVSIVELSEQVIGQIDYEMAAIVHRHIYSKNIDLILRDSVAAFHKGTAELTSGRQLKSDIVIMGMGVAPAVELAVAAGLKIGERGGIVVNDNMATSDADIYALGDSVEMYDHVLGHKTLIQLAGPAHKQASVVAANILGDKKHIRAFQGTTIAKVFDLAVAMTGASEKQLKADKVGYTKSYIDVPSHAPFYPNAHPIVIKLLFNPDGGEVLGAQVVGVEGVDKRIDLLSSAIHFNKTIYDLAELDLAYAPPYSSAKDPVNIAGMVARNMLEDNYQVTYWNEISETSKDVFILDVRTSGEYELGAISRSINIPLEELRDRLDEIPKNKQIVTYCQQGKKGYFAYKILSQHGYENISNLSGGYGLYRVANTREHVKNPMALTFNNLSKTSVINDKASLKESVDIEIDAVGMSCPGPIMRLNKEMKNVNDGKFLLIRASDPGFSIDVETWCRKKGHTLQEKVTVKAITTVLIKKHSS